MWLLLSFKLSCQTKKTKQNKTIQCLWQSQTKIYFLCSCIVFVWCWWMCTLNMLSGLQALYTPPNGRLKMWEWWICARDPNAHRARRERCPIHSYCKSEGTECLFFYFFLLHHISCLKCWNQALLSHFHCDSFLALRYTFVGNWTVMLLEPLHTHLEDVDFSWKLWMNKWMINSAALNRNFICLQAVGVAERVQGTVY